MKYLNVDCTSVICSFLDINKDTYVLDSFSLHEKEKDRVLNYWKNHSKYTIKQTTEGKEWHRNCTLHREGGLPAIERADGRKEWYVNGQLHRDGGLPAVEYADGSKSWYVNGERHREGGLPAVELGKW